MRSPELILVLASIELLGIHKEVGEGVQLSLVVASPSPSNDGVGLHPAKVAPSVVLESSPSTCFNRILSVSSGVAALGCLKVY